MRVDVTQMDIDRGVRSHACACPVAIALKRVTRPDVRSIVMGVQITVTRRFPFQPDDDYYVRSPESVVAFITRFDRNQSVEPFSFDLDIPEALCAST